MRILSFERRNEERRREEGKKDVLVRLASVLTFKISRWYFVTVMSWLFFFFYLSLTRFENTSEHIN